MVVLKLYGGKYYMIKHLMSLIPEHEIYLEVFGGAGHLMMSKPLVEINTYNDINRFFVNFWSVLRDEDKTQQLMQLLERTPFSRYEFHNLRKQYLDLLHTNFELGDVELARLLYVLCYQSSYGNLRCWDPGLNFGKHNVTFYNKINNLESIHDKLKNIILENSDYVVLLNRYINYAIKKKIVMFIYLDPPYVMDTRKSGSAYAYEMTNEQHIELVELIKNIDNTYVKILLSGYDNDIYNTHLSDWNNQIFEIHLKSSSKKDNYVSEKVWYNYEIDKRQIKLF